ncbi:MAG TPA: hypothetical protein VJB02_04035, partial [Coxiellaceae bacterium]|nr:hypothetical protein [Coxiellaceae bacterium]
ELGRSAFFNTSPVHLLNAPVYAAIVGIVYLVVRSILKARKRTYIERQKSHYCALRPEFAHRDRRPGGPATVPVPNPVMQAQAAGGLPVVAYAGRGPGLLSPRKVSHPPPLVVEAEAVRQGAVPL